MQNSSSLKTYEILHIPYSGFHSDLFSVNFFVPLKRETVSAYALVASILTTCSEEFKDYRELNIKLSSLYGADMSSSVTKIGDYLCIKFSVSTIKDLYAFNGEKPMEEAIRLLLAQLFKPNFENGVFCEKDIKRESRILIEHIESELNNKRLFARAKMIENMFCDEDYGVFRYGDTKSIKALTAQGLKTAWEDMLNTAFVKINVIGETLSDNLVNEIDALFGSLKREKIIDINNTKSAKTAKSVKRVTENYDVAQGKLVMGFNCLQGTDKDTVGTLVMCDIFGGGPYSRLFTNVREKLSLCYYCSAYSIRNKGFIMVDSGVEAQNALVAETEIINQLNQVKNGEFTEQEFTASIKGITDTLLASYDNLNALDAWYTARALEEKALSPKELADCVQKVTKEEVVKAAQAVILNTVYKLMPKEEK